MLQNLSAHVMYRLARCRLAGNLLAFSSGANKAMYRAQLKSELKMLQDEHFTMLYGGRMMLQVRQCQRHVGRLCWGHWPGLTATQGTAATAVGVLVGPKTVCVCCTG